MKNSSLRFLISIVGVPLLVYVVFNGGVMLFWTMCVLCFVTLIELVGLLKKTHFQSYSSIVFMVGVMVMSGYWLPIALWSGGLVLIWGGVCILSCLQYDRHRAVFDFFFHSLYISIGWLSFVWLCDLEIFSQKSELGIVVLIVVWTSDIFAYLVGKKWGKRPFFQKISSKKTQEGAIAGTIAGFLVCCGSLYSIFGYWNWLWIGWGLCLVFLIPFGDLLQSMIKRKAEVKDSSNLIPGHGGFFDRFDVLIFISPIAYSLAYLIMEWNDGFS